jgi:hypothetical protein
MLLQVFPPPTPVVAPAGIPVWMQIASFAVATLLGVLRAVEFFRRGTLEVRLTKDSFFRLTDSGETLFVHAVLLDRDGPALIDKVSITMNRLPTENARTAQKSFPLDIVDHGEKIKGATIFAEHSWYGASPLLYVAANSTQRPAYKCLHVEYKDRQQNAFGAFDQEFFNYTSVLWNRLQQKDSRNLALISPKRLKEL